LTLFTATFLRGYIEATEQESSSSGCFLLSGCNGILETTGDFNCKEKADKTKASRLIVNK